MLTEEQRTVLSALAGLDGDGPRAVPEAAELLDTEKGLIAFHMASAARTLMRAVMTPDPQALRLLGSFPAENVAVWRDDLLTAERIVYTFFTRNFPARLRLNIITLWSGGNVDQNYRTGVRVLEPTGEELDRAEGTIEGGQGQMNQVLLLEPLLPEAGQYDIEIWLDGAPLYSYPLYIVSEEEGAHDEN
jgi:hypothetical protein